MLPTQQELEAELAYWRERREHLLRRIRAHQQSVRELDDELSILQQALDLQEEHHAD